MLRIEQHDADRVEGIRLAQSLDHGAQQLRQGVRPQQRKLAGLRALQDGFVVGGLGRQLFDAVPEIFVFSNHLVHVRNPRSRGHPARAAARTSK